MPPIRLRTIEGPPKKSTSKYICDVYQYQQNRTFNCRPFAAVKCEDDDVKASGTSSKGLKFDDDDDDGFVGAAKANKQR